MLLDPLNPKLKWLSFPQTLNRMKSNFLRELSTGIQYQTHQFHLHCFHFHKSDGFWCCFLVYTVCFLWLLIFLFLFSLSLKSSMLILLPGNIRTFECFIAGLAFRWWSISHCLKHIHYTTRNIEGCFLGIMTLRYITFLLWQSV